VKSKHIQQKTRANAMPYNGTCTHLLSMPDKRWTSKSFYTPLVRLPSSDTTVYRQPNKVMGLSTFTATKIR